MPKLKQVLAVAIGGGVGAITRYGAGRLVARYYTAPFPLGTLLINLLGAFLLGAIMAAALDRGALPLTARLALGTGFCGGFTTFSTWMTDSFGLIAAGHGVAALANLLVSAAGGLAAVALGALSARALIHPRQGA